jgi:hypothetical protein
MNTIYPLTGTMMIMGIGAILYGIHSFSFSIFIEGVFLLWLGFSISVNLWEGHRLTT